MTALIRGTLGVVLGAVVSSCVSAAPPRASTDEGGPLITSASSTATPLVLATLDVRTYGAVGDGVSDDTRAIQRAIDLAPRGATVFVPPGIYVIRSAPLVLKSDLRLLGAGRASTLHEPSGSRSIVSANDAENVTVQNLRFTGSGTRIVAGRGAIWAAIGRSYGTRNSFFIDNVIEGVGTSGIVVGNSSNTIVSGNVIVTTLEHGIYVSESSDVLVTRNTINRVGAGGSCGACAGVKLANAVRVRVLGNVIATPSQDGILFDNGTVDSEASGNTVRGAGQYGIRLLQQTRDNLIAENVVEDSGNDAVHATNDLNVVRDNRVIITGGAYR